MAGGGDPVAVGAEGHAAQPARVSAQRENLLAGLQFPQFHVAIHCRSRQALAVGAESDTPDMPNVAMQAEELRAGPGIPHLHLSVGHALHIVGSRGQLFVVAAERHAYDWSAMLARWKLLHPSFHIPDPHALIIA